MALTDKPGARLRAFVCMLGVALTLAGCSWLRATSGFRAASGFDVILSDNTSAYTEVARELARQHDGRVEIYRIDGDSARSLEVLQRVQQSDTTVVVAVGLAAAQMATRLVNKQIIFCQVFNYEDAHLLATGMQGVSATPPVAEQFRYWKRLYPPLKDIGVVTGSGLRALLAEAQAAAREQHIALVRAEVRTDKEMLLAYKQMAPKVQGFWLLPDNRILSRESVRDLLAFSAKQGKQVLVFTPELLGSGALLSAASDPADVAGRVLSIIGTTDRADNASVLPLTRARIRISVAMAKWFDLPLTPELRQLAYEP